ncbi:hypothetical protein [Hymenobacter cellulosivorans]|uniref:Uncharacterized protein n=1 Tax=Hymenobacter cellulosivorans TaxID=2932249 RepID=A0ABY4F641_9BACT|nr:hypothetical protein [Hymenobacter cellulosivorans]UOQ52003.1 hypothetical protein MUN80_19845 [Hymenobacter cellulosivorans]
MGKELRLSGQNFNPEAALQFVQRRFRVEQHGTSLMGLFMLTPEATSARLSSPETWPPVFVSVEATGFYFCDNLCAAQEAALIFKQLCEFMLTTNEDIQVAEL